MRFLEVCHPDCELQPFLRARDDDVPYRSSDGIRQWFTATDAAFDRVMHDVVDVREANGALVALGTLTYRGKISGVEVTSPVGWLLEFRDGKIARGRTYIEPERALDDADFTATSRRSPPELVGKAAGGPPLPRDGDVAGPLRAAPGPTVVQRRRSRVADPVAG